MFNSRSLNNDAQNIEKLMAIPILSDFNSDRLESILKNSQIREFDDGETIIREGDLALWLYFLISGGVRITKEGREVTSLRRKGDIFGETGAKFTSDRSTGAYAIGRTVCLTTQASHLDSYSRGDKIAFGYLLFRVLCESATEHIKTLSRELKAAREEIALLKSRVGAGA